MFRAIRLRVPCRAHIWTGPIKRIIALLSCLALGLFVWLGWDRLGLNHLFNPEDLHTAVTTAGAWGPIVVITLMVLAIVCTPIPSGPIAMAAGAAYGDLWGTIYVLIGAELGAFIAFGIARLLGHDLLRKWFGDKIEVGLLGSQNALMGLVFASRLLPFLSFDIISYAAGLSVLHFWRFALATLAGIIPASFLLAHLGSAALSENPKALLLAILALGLLTGLPLLIAYLRKTRR